MAHTEPSITAPVDDTPDAAYVPVDERPPYAGRPRWKVWLVAALVVAALVMAVWGTVRVLRRLFVLLFVDGPAPARLDSEVIVLSEMPTGGLMYRVRFFDGTYEQLTDREIAIVVDSGLPYEVVDRQLAALAAQLASAVYARDGQVCFRPRLVLVNAAGTAVREWTAPTWS